MATVLLIRHGESQGNAGARTTGAATNPLTPRGERQATLVAETLDPPPDLIVCSPYLRARQTAQPTIDRHPAARLAHWPIGEFSYLGRFHGKPTTTAERAHAADAYWRAADPGYRDDENSESFADVHTRARTFLARLAEEKAERTAAFTHGLFMRVVLWTILTGEADPDSENMRRFHAFRQASLIPNAGILHLVHDNDTNHKFLTTTTAHIPPALQTGGP